MGSKLKDTGVQFPDGTTQTTATASSISTMEIFYASTDFVKPVGVTRLEITLVGGGAAASELSQISGSNVTFDTAGYPEHYGSPTSITIQGTTHIARGGSVRSDFNRATHKDFVSGLNEYQKYGGEAGYLGEDGFTGSHYWNRSYPHGTANPWASQYFPDYAVPYAIGGFGYGYEGGSLKDHADNFTVSNHNTGDNYQKKDPDTSSWAGGAGAHVSATIGTTNYLSHGGNGGGIDFGVLGGSWSFAPADIGTVYSGHGNVGGGGGAATVVGKFVGGGGGGAGAGGGGASTTSAFLYGGAAGRVVTFHIDVPSAEATYPIVIGAGGDGYVQVNICGGGGGQGVVIIKY